MCITDNKPENYANVCSRFQLHLHFEHSRLIEPGQLKWWILQVANRTSGNLTASYAGSKPVRSDQLITFSNARFVELEDRAHFCDGVEEQLIESSYLLNYTILAVSCDKFKFVPFESRDIPTSDQIRLPFKTRLRRRVQNTEFEIGTLDVEMTVTAEYTYANRVEEARREEQFGVLVEVRILDRSGWH